MNSTVYKNTIQIYEYDWLKVGDTNRHGFQFNANHFTALDIYLTHNTSCGFFRIFHNKIQFCNYVGVIKVGNLIIEVLPKTDKNNEPKEVWQNVLLEMLKVSLKVNAKTTTHANIQLSNHSVLETYLQLFLNEVKNLLHEGLVKKYRQIQSNENVLKGKLLIQKQVSKNLVHAEKFYVAHQVYNRDNIYNFIILETIHCIQTLNVSSNISMQCKTLLLDFPECSRIPISEKVFSSLIYGRKTERYKAALDLARIILLNYHPDIKSGQNNILAIMFDMNLLWENYIYYIVKTSSLKNDKIISVTAQSKKYFWSHDDNWKFRLKPDIFVQTKNNGNIILDTKWKYQKETSIEDIRQMYAYSKYFEANENYLVYPDTNVIDVIKRKGKFYNPQKDGEFDTNSCGLMFVNLLENGKLNSLIGLKIVERINTT